MGRNIFENLLILEILIKTVTSRDEARDLLAPLKKSELVDLAKELNMTIPSGTKSVMAERIVRRIIGSKLDMQSILSC